MFLKLSFVEKTHPRCMNLSVSYKLENRPTIIEQVPEGAVADKQVRSPIEPGLNEMFGIFNACRYEYYFNCGEADAKMINRMLDVLYATSGGESPNITADEDYLTQNKNLIVHAITFTLATLKTDGLITDNALRVLIAKEMVGEVQKHQMESIKKFTKMMMFGESNSPLSPEDEAKVEQEISKAMTM